MRMGMGDVTTSNTSGAPLVTAALDSNAACWPYPQSKDYPTFEAYNTAALACDNAVKTCNTYSFGTGLSLGFFTFMAPSSIPETIKLAFGPIKPNTQTVNGTLCPPADNWVYRAGILTPFVGIELVAYYLFGRGR